MATVAPANPPPIEHELYCPQCAYDLRGITSDRCPECGQEVDRASRCVSRIPWEHRHDIGRVRAYLRTLVLATFPTRRFAQEIAHPISYSAAQRFRWITVLLAYAPLAGLLWTLWHKLDLPFSPNAEFDPMLWLFVGLAIGILLFLAAATGLASYFFHPRSLPMARQNRGIAFSYYACAPLGWLLIVVPAGVAGGFAGPDVALGGTLLVATAIAAVLLPIVWLSNVGRLLKAATACGTGQLIVFHVVHLLLLAAMAVLLLVVLPCLLVGTVLLLRPLL